MLCSMCPSVSADSALHFQVFGPNSTTDGFSSADSLGSRCVVGHLDSALSLRQDFLICLYIYFLRWFANVVMCVYTPFLAWRVIVGITSID